MKKVLYLAILGALFVPSFAKADTGSYLSVTKQVRNVSSGSGFSSSASARPGDTIEYNILVKNVTQSQISGIAVLDSLSGSSGARTTLSVSRAYSGHLDSGNLQIANLEAGGTAEIQYRVVLQSGGVDTTSCSAATATVYGQAVSSSACVYISSAATPPAAAASFIRQSVSASNDTKNASGTSLIAMKEDFITVTFSATNSGTQTQFGYVQQADLSGMVPLVDAVDLGGGTLSGSTLSFPSVAIAPGASVTRSIRVRIKYFLPPHNFVLKVSYGNDLVISVRNSSAGVATYTAPNAGAALPAAAGAFGLGAVFIGFLCQKKFRTLLFT